MCPLRGPRGHAQDESKCKMRNASLGDTTTARGKHGTVFREAAAKSVRHVLASKQRRLRLLHAHKHHASVVRSREQQARSNQSSGMKISTGGFGRHSDIPLSRSNFTSEGQGIRAVRVTGGSLRCGEDHVDGGRLDISPLSLSAPPPEGSGGPVSERGGETGEILWETLRALAGAEANYLHVAASPRRRPPRDSGPPHTRHPRDCRCSLRSVLRPSLAFRPSKQSHIIRVSHPLSVLQPLRKLRHFVAVVA